MIFLGGTIFKMYRSLSPLFLNLKDNVVSLPFPHSSYSIKNMTEISLWTLVSNSGLSRGELLKIFLIWNAERIHILPKGLLCILIFYAFYSSKREKKQVEVIEVARCWWHPFHCNDSHDFRFCLALLFLWIANLQVATATLYTDK